MGKKYRVHGRHETTVGVKATDADGNECMALAPAIIVELVPLDGFSGSVRETIRTPTKKAVEDTLALFEQDGVVEHLGYKKVEKE